VLSDTVAEEDSKQGMDIISQLEIKWYLIGNSSIFS